MEGCFRKTGWSEGRAERMEERVGEKSGGRREDLLYQKEGLGYQLS